MSEIQVGPYTVPLSSLDKVLFPEAGLTKGDLVRYYRRIAGRMLPYLRERPLTLHRFPNGIQAGGFIQQQAADYFPAWIDRATVEKEAGTITHAVCNNEATLVYLANQGVITPHVWLSRTDRPHHPDRMIFDLDPPGDAHAGTTFDPVRRAARAVRALLNDLGLSAFVMTTGSSGLHVVTPLDRSADFEAVRAFARTAAELLATQHPDALTTEQRKEKRRGRVFLDTLRNAYGQTAVPPYAVRARASAPVATPLDWEELGQRDLHPQRYTIGNLFRRLSQKEDPWAGIEQQAHALAEPHHRLTDLRQSLDSAP
jgi:bifunctional non-homologous end joining protein LigD